MSTLIARRSLIGGALAGMLLSQRLAAAPGQEEDLRLAVDWVGTHVADLRLRCRQEGSLIDTSMEITSRGIVSWVTSYRGQLRTTARVDNGRLIPSRYRAHYETRRYTRDIAIGYDGSGNPTAIDLRKRGEPQTVDIPKELWVDTVDPLTAILRVRAWAARRDRTATERVRVFDSRSCYDIEVNALLAPDAAVTAAKLVIRPIASSSKSSWLDDWQDDQGRWLEARFTSDSRAVPVLVETHGDGSSSSIRLEKDCSPPDVCS